MSDKRIRELEKAAYSGDIVAGKALLVERDRIGLEPATPGEFVLFYTGEPGRRYRIGFVARRLYPHSYEIVFRWSENGELRLWGVGEDSIEAVVGKWHPSSREYGQSDPTFEELENILMTMEPLPIDRSFYSRIRDDR